MARQQASSQEHIDPCHPLGGSRLEGVRHVRLLALASATIVALGAVACSDEATPESDEGSLVSAHAVVGEDDRVRITDTTAFPWRAIAYLELHYDSTAEVGQCTGTFIGPDAVLTAAHCLWDRERGWVDRVRVVPGKNGREEPFGSEWASGFWVPAAWIDEEQPALRDWGVVALPDYSLGQRVGWLPLPVLEDAELIAPGFEVAIVGYHGDVKPDGSLWGQFADGLVAVQDSNLLYDIDATQGSSGSAVLGTNHRVVGIHAYGLDLGESEGYNFGSRVTTRVVTDLTAGCESIGCTVWPLSLFEHSGFVWTPAFSPAEVKAIVGELYWANGLPVRESVDSCYQLGRLEHAWEDWIAFPDSTFPERWDISSPDRSRYVRFYEGDPSGKPYTRASSNAGEIWGKQWDKEGNLIYHAVAYQGERDFTVLVDRTEGFTGHHIDLRQSGCCCPE